MCCSKTDIRFRPINGNLWPRNPSHGLLHVLLLTDVLSALKDLFILYSSLLCINLWSPMRSFSRHQKRKCISWFTTDRVSHNTVRKITSSHWADQSPQVAQAEVVKWCFPSSTLECSLHPTGWKSKEQYNVYKCVWLDCIPSKFPCWSPNP